MFSKYMKISAAEDLFVFLVMNSKYIATVDYLIDLGTQWLPAHFTNGIGRVRTLDQAKLLERFRNQKTSVS